MKTDIYNAQGKKAGSVELPEGVFGVPWNASLIHQVVTSMQDNARSNVAHTKGRGDVRGGGKKPWKQKGTGRARAGSSRSPIWKGGGVTHGPSNEKVFARTIPKKMRAKALAIALSQKMRDGEMVFVDSFGIDGPKTAVARKALVSLSDALGIKRLSEKRVNAAVVAFADPREAAFKSFRNIGNVELRSVRELNPVSILKNSYVVFENPDAAIAILSHRILGDAAKTVTETPKKKVSAKKPAAKKGAVKNAKAVHATEKGDQ